MPPKISITKDLLKGLQRRLEQDELFLIFPKSGKSPEWDRFFLLSDKAIPAETVNKNGFSNFSVFCQGVNVVKCRSKIFFLTFKNVFIYAV